MAAGLMAQEVVWEAALPFRDLGRLRVANGIIYSGNITGRGGTVAFDAATGKLLWRVGGQQRGGPIPAGKLIYTTNHELGSLALDAKTGRTVWRAPEYAVANYADIAYDGTTVYVVGFAGKLWALDGATGKLRWEHEHQAGGRAGGCLAAPVIGEGILIYGGGWKDGINHLVWGLDPATGKELWSAQLGCAGVLALSGETAVLATGSQLVAIEARSGKVLWRNVAAAPLKANWWPVVADGRVYGIHEDGLIGIDLKSGQKVFEYAGNFPNSDSRSHLQIVDGKAFFVANFEQAREAGNRRGYLYKLDLATKKILWRHRVNRDKKYAEDWSTKHFVVDGEFVYYENESLLVKLRH